MLSILDTALVYLRQGIPAIPSDPKTKIPLVKWTDYQSRLPTKEETISMFSAHPKAMISLVCGQISNLMVVDADSPEAVKLIEDAIPDSMETTIDVSPRGGRHYWWLANGKKWQTKASVLKNIDIRANGGVIVAPPSRNDTGGQYRWLTGLDFDKSRLQEMPESLCNLLASAQVREKNANENNEELKKLWNGTSEGGRNGSLTRLVGAWVKLELSKEECLFNANLWNQKNKPPLPESEIISVINSVFNTDTRNHRNLAEEIRQWIEETHGDFDYKSCDFDLDLKSKGEKTNRRLVFHRMKKDNKIVGVSGKNGWFRKKEGETIYADYVNVVPSSFTLDMPLGISNIVKFSPKAIIVVAGSTNAGKTNFLLNVVKANNYKFFYFNSEMSAEKFRERLDDFGLQINFWDAKMKMIEKVDNIVDHIKPNDINIIDYLETDWEKPWLVSKKIREIFDSLDKGMAIIGLQMKSGTSVPRGGEGALEKAQFAICLDIKGGDQFHKAKILKAKTPSTKFNPNFCTCDFTYGNNYTTFLKINDWRRE